MVVKYPFATSYIDNQSLSDAHATFDQKIDEPTIKISFVVPCLNEEEHILAVLKTLIIASKECKLSYEIIVVDDNSADKSVSIIRSFTEKFPKFPIRLVENKTRKGVASNFFYASEIGRGKYFRMVNGDNVEPFTTHKAIYRAIGKADLLVPDYHTILNRKVIRSVISKSYTFLVNLASGLTLNYYNGCPVYLREDIFRYSVKTKGLGFSAEMVTKLILSGRTYHRIPLVGYDQEGSTALTLNNFFSVGVSLTRIFYRRIRSKCAPMRESSSRKQQN